MDEYRVFTKPGEEQVLVEIIGDGLHVVAPAPFFGPCGAAMAVEHLGELHPDSAVYELLDEADIAEAMEYAS